MKKTLLLVWLCLSIYPFLSQELEESNNLNSFYFYWGWNRGWFSNSDISLTGENYDFTLNKVKATDRPTAFDPAIYFHPGLFTIPQFNFRFGYFIKENYTISFGIDHMKYVMTNNQSVKISGEINNLNNPYYGLYDNDDFIVKEDFLKFEHTDGLNFVNIECRRFDKIFEYKKININITEGLGLGILYPKTNATLMNNDRYDDFNLAGFGLLSVAGVNIKFYNKFFIQSELKGGYINMPNIRTTLNKIDRAKQSFAFAQFNWLFGMSFNIRDYK